MIFFINGQRQTPFINLLEYIVYRILELLPYLILLFGVKLKDFIVYTLSIGFIYLDEFILLIQ